MLDVLNTPRCRDDFVRLSGTAYLPIPHFLYTNMLTAET